MGGKRRGGGSLQKKKGPWGVWTPSVCFREGHWEGGVGKCLNKGGKEKEGNKKTGKGLQTIRKEIRVEKGRMR